MGQIERLTTSERLRLARKRRGLQLKRWAQREREYNLKRKQCQEEQEENTSRVNFVPAIMLLEAAARNDIEEVRRLLSLGVSPDSTNEDGLTALHQCCIDDSEEMMKVLVEFGANVNAADSEQWTPLHAAATCGHLHLVKFLIEKEASLLAVNGDGNMPYDICEDETTLSFIENEMAKRGVTQELIDETRGRTEAKMLADLAQLAAEHGDLEFRDKHRATPLHIAAANGYLSVLEFLLDNHCSTEVLGMKNINFGRMIPLFCGKIIIFHYNHQIWTSGARSTQPHAGGTWRLSRSLHRMALTSALSPGNRDNSNRNMVLM